MVIKFDVNLKPYINFIANLYLDIDLCTKTKFLSIATCIFNNFGKSSDIENLVVAKNDDAESNMVMYFR
jgi:hypothetical protein